MNNNFDNIPNRRNTFSLKWDVSENELPMWVADMDFETAPCIKEALIERAKHGVFGYSIIPDEFFESIIGWWQRRHHITFEKDWMIFSTGVVPAISSIVRKITTPAENVLIQSPVYNIFYNSIFNNGRNILSSDLVYENGEYHIDFVDLENKLKNPQTTLMILCNPHNPIGKIWSKEELAKIGELCHKYNVTVISDEIHCDITNPGKEYIPFASVNDVCRDISITCIAGSKVFNLGGLQSACVVVPNKFLKHKVERGLNTDEVAEPNAFAMSANIAGFKYGDEWVSKLNNYIYENKKIFCDYVNKNLPKLYIIPSDATYLLWVDVRKYTDDATTLCEYLRSKTGLYVCEGSEYGVNGKAFFRINLATSKYNVLDALERLKAGLELFESETK